MQNIKTIPQLAVQNLPADLESKADADEVVLLTGNQTVEGNKNLTETPVIQLWNADINPTANQTIVFSINSLGTFELYKNKTGNNGSNPPAQDGTNWEFISTCQGSRAYVQEFAASESPVSSVTLTEGVCYNADFMTVAVDHTILDPSAYTLGINGTTITFDEPVQAGLTITVRWFTEMNLSNVYRQPLLTCFWSDHLIYELSYLCADPFSWQDGNVYSAVYNHLVNDFANAGSWQLETIAGHVIGFKLASDGHKIVDATNATLTALENIYNATGVAWYYILDVENHRFKLPRTKYAFSGWRGNVGEYIPESLPNITAHADVNNAFGSSTGAFYKSASSTVGTFSTQGSVETLGFDASRSSSTYQNNAPVQQRGTQMYLYFYVGNYTPQAIEQTAGYAQTLTELKADKDLVNSPYTTNRILEIPQDIKLELNNGSLVRKAGSKFYIPNGFESDGTTPKFDVVTISQDQASSKPTATYTRLVFVYDSNNPSGFSSTSEAACFSGPTAPSTYNIMIWYDTSTNLIKITTNRGSSWSSGYSLPYAIASTTASDGFISIDKIFNGFGYIGSTVFVLPGVKVQAPNGKNEDGTYRSNILTQTTVGLTTFTANASGVLVVRPNSGIPLFASSWHFDSENGYISTSDNIPTNKGACILCGYLRTESLRIVDFTFGDVDSVANSNASNLSQAGRSYLSSLGMPSSKYETWTLGATYATYTAPANGSFYVRKLSSAAGQYLAVYYFDSANNPIGRNEWSSGANQTLTCMITVQKGTVVHIDYNAGGASNLFQFIYAEGEV